MTSFNQLIAENNNDPQWLLMVQSLLNYKQKLVEQETKTNTSSAKTLNTNNKHNINKYLATRQPVHTINGVQYIRKTHLTAILNDSKLLKSDVEFLILKNHVGFARGYDYVKLSNVAQWIYEKNAKIKKVWLKKYGN